MLCCVPHFTRFSGQSEAIPVVFVFRGWEESYRESYLIVSLDCLCPDCPAWLRQPSTSRDDVISIQFWLVAFSTTNAITNTTIIRLRADYMTNFRPGWNMNLGMRTARVVNVKRFPVNFPAQFCPSGFGPPGGSNSDSENGTPGRNPLANMDPRGSTFVPPSRIWATL